MTQRSLSWTPGNFDVAVERRGDGTIFIRPRLQLSSYPVRVTDRLEYWAEYAPERTFVARRDATGAWQRFSYAEVLSRVRSIAAGLAARSLSKERPIAILSGNSIEHLLMALAAMYVGVPHVPVSPPYSQVSSDLGKLRYVLKLLTPGLVVAFGSSKFERAIAEVVDRDVEVIADTSTIAGRAATTLQALEKQGTAEQAESAHASVGPDTIAKFLILYRDFSESHRLDRMRADFVANASHELRTPLASISGFIDTLRGPAKDDVTARDRFLGIMQEQATRMSRLIDDLLSLSRLEMRSLTDEAMVLDLVSVADEAIDSMQPVASESGVEIERHFAGGPFLIRGMRDEIIQIVENLVENACKYGKQGKRGVLEIKQRKIDDTGEVILSVSDFGPGIDAEHLPRLTERFYRASANSGSVQKGTGLGLAIVKHIATRHRGRLSISSQLGKGSTFAIYLPQYTGPDVYGSN